MDSIEIGQKLEVLGFEYNKTMEFGEKWNGCTTDEFEKYVEEHRHKEHPINIEPVEEHREEHLMDIKPTERYKEEHPINIEEHLRGAPESYNVNRNIKLNKSLDDEVKRQAEELGSSVSKLIRDVLQDYFNK